MPKVTLKLHKKELYLYSSSLKSHAGDRNRTGTGIATHGILSPGRLPVPPRRHMKNKKVLTVMQYLMDGGGFEPPKQFAADLQSVPFGHSGIHPCAGLTGITQSPDKLYLYHNRLQKATVFYNYFDSLIISQIGVPSVSGKSTPRMAA